MAISGSLNILSASVGEEMKVVGLSCGIGGERDGFPIGIYIVILLLGNICSYCKGKVQRALAHVEFPQKSYFLGAAKKTRSIIKFSNHS